MGAMCSELTDRILWFDGTTSILATDIKKYINYADTGRLHVDETTKEIDDYNRVSTKKVKPKKGLLSISTEWNIPEHIKKINILDFLIEKLDREIRLYKLSEEEIEERQERIAEEYEIMKKGGLEPLIYVILYIINKFEETDTVWGVGRGSSTSSYILYLLGLHDVDSVHFGLDFSEFIH